MNTLQRSRFFMLVVILALIATLPLTAQDQGKGLIVSEVCLDADSPSNNWIEIYNPTENPLTLERIRQSGVETLDVLPLSVQREGGIAIAPGAYLVLCADKAQLESVWGETLMPITVIPLGYLEKGGFITLVTKDLGEAGKDGFRYGDPDESNYIGDYLGDQVLGFSENGLSYSRLILESDSGLLLADFAITVPTPGRRNNEE